MNVIFLLRVWCKLILRRYILLNSFCKKCGCEVNDFIAPDIIWNVIEKDIPHKGHILCYNCFIRLCKKNNLPTIYKLETIHGWDNKD